MWQPTVIRRITKRPVKHAILAVLLSSLLIVSLGMVATSTATAEATVQLDDLQVPNDEFTVNGELEEVLLNTQISYEYDVEDADMRIVDLKVGSSESDLERLEFDYEQNPGGSDSGTVQLEGSLFDAEEFNAEMLQPALASTETTEIVVQVGLEVQRENGESVEAYETETVELTLNDGGELTAAVGGSVTITVEDSG